ncbi:MAG: hypothetical protein Q620_VSAC00072G0002, partial [Veillonella sp. DORA_A_3_16_22]
ITLLLFYNFWGITQYFCESFIQKYWFCFEFHSFSAYIIYNTCESMPIDMVRCNIYNMYLYKNGIIYIEIYRDFNIYLGGSYERTCSSSQCK